MRDDVSELPKEIRITGLHENCSGCHHIVGESRCVYRQFPASGTTWPCFFRETCTKEDAQRTIAEVR